MPEFSIREFINNPHSVSREWFSEFMHKLSLNYIEPIELVAVLTALSVKKISAKDIEFFVSALHELYPQKRVQGSENAVNIVGTGGGISTFNISTTAAIVACAAGATIIKSGSPRFTSTCGSLDLLKSLGIQPAKSINDLEFKLAHLGIAFVDPNLYPPVLKRMALMIMPLSLREIGQFINIIGPLICPIRVSGQLIGVSSKEILEEMANSACTLNMNNVAICWSDLGMDEFSSVGTNYVITIQDGIKKYETIRGQEQFGFKSSDISELKGWGPHENAKIVRSLFNCEIMNIKYETVLLNSAYLLVLARVAESIQEGIEKSRLVIATGVAREKLNQITGFGHGKS